MLWLQSTMLFQQPWVQKTEKSSAAPKLCGLPPTTEAFEQHVWWRSAKDQPPVDYGWIADEANKCLIPRNMAEVE